jgi:hypothetical protein
MKASLRYKTEVMVVNWCDGVKEGEGSAVGSVGKM